MTDAPADLDTCPPLYATPREPSRRTLGGQVSALADVLGLTLMPWQRYVADVAFELNDDGSLWYREINLTVPRQCGKSAMVLVLALHRMLVFSDKPQRVTYAAQDVVGASRTWRTQLWPIVEESGVAKAEALKLRRSLSDTGISAPDGSELSVLTSAPTSGHGTTVGLAFIDEAMSLTNADREQAMLPAMRTVPDAQMWVVSTAGNEHSIYLYNKVRRGRERCLERRTDSRVAYFEWGAPEDADWTDRDVWRAAVPALGHTVTMEALEHEFETMDPAEFRRAALNQWPARASDPVIPWVLWERACVPDAAPTDPLILAVDGPPDRSDACMVVAGGSAVEVIDQRRGIDWILDSIRERHERHGFVSIVGAASSPCRAHLETLSEHGLPVRIVSWGWMADACGKFSDDVQAGRVRLRRSSTLDEAMLGAVRKPYDKGSKYTWWRDFREINISLLWAATMAWFECWRLAHGQAAAAPSLLVAGQGDYTGGSEFEASVGRWSEVWSGGGAR